MFCPDLELNFNLFYKLERMLDNFSQKFEFGGFRFEVATNIRLQQSSEKIKTIKS